MVFETSQRLDKWVEKHRKECKTRATEKLFIYKDNL